MNRYGSNYIYAPIKDGWYNIDAIKKGLPQHYDLLLIDGQKIGRRLLSDHLDLFNTNVPIIVDDSDRGREMKLLKDMVEKLGRNFTSYKGRDHRGKGTMFAIFDKVE